MKVPSINLHRPYAAPRWSGIAVLLLSVAALVAVMQGLDRLHARAARMDDRESEITRAEQARAQVEHAHRNPAPRRTALQAQQAYAVEPARDLLERGWQPDIAMLRIDIATATREMHLVFEARSIQTALSYIDWLDAQPSTESVQIERQAEKPGPAGDVMEVGVVVHWKPAGGAVAATEPAP
ncbi:hypothetical protein SAMN04487785_109178 [Dyella jiangningensis]|uniref:hypothetical protein n=1 Tax=Dyella sp. AtDHG13 TaxID=1938897 RepID=UPI000880CCE1|nr:hypothetical protein [Dyella sp. AtDHG13]PXV57054.1 hypothetical protein BDW41_108176 [Dyella sp. AtDHG13]SDK65463.1 hypothetical protein SAMN04487785_109178 [Dyella jiangningensis]